MPGDVLTVADIDRLVSAAKDKGLRPITYKGSEFYMVIVHPRQVADMNARNRIQRRRALKVARMLGFDTIFHHEHAARVYLAEVIKGAWHRKKRRYQERRAARGSKGGN